MNLRGSNLSRESKLMFIYKLGVSLHWKKLIDLIKSQWSIQVSGSALVTKISTCDNMLQSTEWRMKNQKQYHISESRYGEQSLLLFTHEPDQCIECQRQEVEVRHQLQWSKNDLCDLIINV